MRDTDGRLGARLGMTGLVGSAALALAAAATLVAGVVLQRAFGPAVQGLAPLSWPLWIAGALLAAVGAVALAVAAGGLVGGAAYVGTVRLVARVRSGSG